MTAFKGFIVTDDGHWVNQKFEDLARILQEYDKGLSLAWIPTDKRTTDEKYPYCVIHNNNGYEYIVCYVEEDNEPYQILAHIIQTDNKNDSVIDKLDAELAAKTLLNMQEWKDKLAEAHEKTIFLFNTPLHYITDGRDEEGKLIRMDETRRRI